MQRQFDNFKVFLVFFEVAFIGIHKGRTEMALKNPWGMVPEGRSDAVWFAYETQTLNILITVAVWMI